MHCSSQRTFAGAVLVCLWSEKAFIYFRNWEYQTLTCHSTMLQNSELQLTVHIHLEGSTWPFRPMAKKVLKGLVSFEAVGSCVICQLGFEQPGQKWWHVLDWNSLKQCLWLKGEPSCPLLYAHGFQEELSVRCVTLSLTGSAATSACSSPPSHFQLSSIPSFISLCMASTCSALRAPLLTALESARRSHYLPPTYCLALWFVVSTERKSPTVEGQHRRRLFFCNSCGNGDKSSSEGKEKMSHSNTHILNKNIIAPLKVWLTCELLV